MDNSQHIRNKAYVRDQVIKWREERRKRLAARILHNRQGAVSSAIFGTVTSSDATTQPTNKLPSSVAPAVKNKPHKNTKPRPNSAPEIKHNVASKLRMIKANPLLEARGLVTIPPKKKTQNTAGRNTGHTGDLHTVPLSSSLQHRATFMQSSSLDSNGNEMQGSRVNAQPVKTESFVRRSLSAGPPVNRLQANNATEATNIRRIQSTADIRDIKDTVIKEENEEPDDDRFPLLPHTQRRYQTPQRARSSLFLNSVKRDKMQSLSSSIYAPTPDVMRKCLSDWLYRRGKSLQNFSHLHCFGLQASHMAHNPANCRKSCKPQAVNRKNKEREVQENHTSGTLPSAAGTEQETLPNEQPAYSNPVEENKENACVGKSDQLVQDAIKDLLNIIHIGYPWDKGEEWLTMICRFYPGVKEVPIYWECVAALEEARGDFTSAVHCYEKAIIHGASLSKVDESLEQLMEKFNILNIKCDVGKDKNTSVKTQNKHEVDARNIFKSTIIKFAQLQKVLKRNNLGTEAMSANYVTPVRRSTRASLSHYRSTPRLQYVNSLQQLEAGVRFQPNHAFDF